ncbi:hypothetical protein V8G54_030897 [Vigna mungo]|uniref:Uncharacterized protein n=1 Tax=Vigna mungo TaxID=3915 RepID=A0AAQ3MXD0_VIGMU
MSEAKSQIESLRKWVVEHKLRAVGKFLSSLVCSVSVAQRYHGVYCVQLVSTQYETQCEDHSRKLMLLSNVSELSNLRLHAQALTLGALAGAALLDIFPREKMKLLEVFFHNFGGDRRRKNNRGRMLEIMKSGEEEHVACFETLEMTLEMNKAPDHHYLVHDQLLYWKGRLVIPNSHNLMKQMLNEFHTSLLGGYVVMAKTLARI